MKMKTPVLKQNELPMLITLDANIDMHKMNIIYIWVKVFKNGPSTIYGRQSLKNLK